MTQSKQVIEWRYILLVTVSVLSGCLAFAFGHELIDKNTEATQVIVTVFSILAGFLIAIMTLLGDQSVLPGSWRIAEVTRTKIQVKLIRQKWLFYVYLITLTIIFVAALLRMKYPETTALLERIYLGFATSSFILSFGLPSTLMSVQMERVEAVIGARRSGASKLDRS
jgi:hypothetical protein